MKSKAIAKALIGIVVIGGGLGYFIFQAAASSSSYSFTLDEFLSGEDAAGINSIRLAGSVKTGSVTKDIEQMLLSLAEGDSFPQEGLLRAREMLDAMRIEQGARGVGDTRRKGANRYSKDICADFLSKLDQLRILSYRVGRSG